MKTSVLFLCVRNSARSIMAEYILRNLAGDRFVVFSAGSQPGGKVHPLTIDILRKKFNIDARAARSKSWNHFLNFQFDLVFTLCRKGRETCPDWKGQSRLAHWEIIDPEVGTTEDLRELKFITVAEEIHDRIKEICNLSDQEITPYRTLTYKDVLQMKNPAASSVVLG